MCGKYKKNVPLARFFIFLEKKFSVCVRPWGICGL